MNAEEARLKSRACIRVPAKYRPSTLADRKSGRIAGMRPFGARSGRQESSKTEVSMVNPVQRSTRSYSSVARSPSARV